MLSFETSIDEKFSQFIKSVARKAKNRIEIAKKFGQDNPCVDVKMLIIHEKITIDLFLNSLNPKNMQFSFG